MKVCSIRLIRYVSELHLGTKRAQAMLNRVLIQSNNVFSELNDFISKYQIQMTINNLEELSLIKGRQLCNIYHLLSVWVDVLTEHAEETRTI